MHKGHWEKLEDLLAEMTEDEKRRAVQRIAQSIQQADSLEPDEEVRRQWQEWQEFWERTKHLQRREPGDGLIGSIDVDKIVYGEPEKQ